MNVLRTDISPHITSYDLLKTFAIITMIIDHLGYYFYPEIQELRLIGRLSAPVWFFLIGYAINRKLEWRLWIGGLIMMGATALYVGNPAAIFPLNILLTFLLIRLSLNYIMLRITRKFEALFGFFWICLIFMLPSLFIFEYGTLGFLCAFLGYIARHRDKLTNLKPQNHLIYAACTAFAYIAGMSIWFGFNWIDIALLSVMITMIIIWLALYFKPHEFNNAKIPPLFKGFLMICGRRTLEIYVLHSVLFMALAAYYF